MWPSEGMGWREGLADPAVRMAFPGHSLTLICPGEFSSFSDSLEMEKLLGLVSISFNGSSPMNSGSQSAS